MDTTKPAGRERCRGEIREIVEQTRSQQLAEWEDDPETVDELVESGEMTDPLLGHCPNNAAALAAQLYSAGYTPTIVYGGLVDGDVTIDTVQEAFRLVRFHIWVEILPETNDDAPLIVEIAAEYDGGVRISNELPEHYTRPPESRVRYHPEIVTPARLRNINGYNHLKDENLVL